MVQYLKFDDSMFEMSPQTKLVKPKGGDIRWSKGVGNC